MAQYLGIDEQLATLREQIRVFRERAAALRVRFEALEASDNLEIAAFGHALCETSRRIDDEFSAFANRIFELPAPAPVARDAP